mmetsp:Transcript_8328/g.22212  ORF Transcript_8328/g.22212 Transcript_8328/m.22212 type:complete len:85 (+) Transcript_8328:99-353(+)
MRKIFGRVSQALLPLAHLLLMTRSTQQRAYAAHGSLVPELRVGGMEIFMTASASLALCAPTDFRCWVPFAISWDQKILFATWSF